jgi:hypothetical protein
VRTSYFAQPDIRLGDLLMEALATAPTPRRVVIVSAFAALQTIMRLKVPLINLRESGTAVSVVLGLDMGGTSKEVLQQLSTWNVNVTVVKNRIPGHTFHPKLYLLEWETLAKIVVGSNNATEGGFYRNYEASACTQYDLPADAAQYAGALRELRRFIQPEGPTAKQLTPAYLRVLLARADVPTEAAARERTTSQFRRTAGDGNDHAFGSEVISPPPPLPSALLERLIANITPRRQAGRRRARPIAERREEIQRAEQVSPAAFYMSLPTLQGRNIPGEGRIPLAAIELAEQFWGWPEKYARTESPRRGQKRVYHEWKPIWRIWNVEREDAVEQPVRMYMYENSSDFRFYARPLVNAGADLGDIVRIVRVAEPAVEFECALAKAGTAEHRSWQSYCTTQVRGSARRFGFG